MRISSRPPIERFALIDQALREGKWPNATSLAEAIEVAPRTIQRDIRYLRDRLKAPIEFDPTHKGYRYTDPAFRLSFPMVSEGEALALFLAERLLQAYGDAPFAADLARLFDKIKAFLPDRVSLDLGHLAAATSIRNTPTLVADATRWQELYQAVRERRQLEVTYWTASRDETCRRVVDPFHLCSIDGDWFLIGFCHLREEVRSFAPARIRDLHPTGRSFEIPADFRIAEYLDAGFRKFRGVGELKTVRLRFAATAARFIREKIIHPTQRIEEHPDGSLILTVEVNHLLEIRRWAMSWGSECEVLEPGELEEEVFSEIGKMVEKRERRRRGMK